MGQGVDRVGADDPGRSARDLVETYRNLGIAHRLIALKDSAHQALQGVGHGIREYLGKSSAEVLADRGSRCVGKDPIDANKAKLTVEEGQPDGRIGQHGIEEGERVTQSGTLLFDRGHHAVEGLNQLPNFIVNGNRQGKLLGRFRGLHHGASASAQDGERLGDGPTQTPGQEHGSNYPDGAEDGQRIPGGLDLFFVPAFVCSYPGIAVQVALQDDGHHAFHAFCSGLKDVRTAVPSNFLEFGCFAFLQGVKVRIRGAAVKHLA